MPEMPDERSAAPPRSHALLLTLITFAIGALVANLYYAQPIIGLMAPELGLSPEMAGLIPSVTQLSYGAGLFFLVSLTDLVENKLLVLINIAGTVLGLLLLAASGGPATFFIGSCLLGFCATAAQVLLPFSAHLIPEERRGRVIGNMMAGILTGIMLARPVSLFLAGTLGWRGVFWTSAGLLVLVWAGLAWLMPRHRPAGGARYGQILASVLEMMRSRPGLRSRAVYAALMFGAFNMFWTAAPVMLADRFGLSEHAIGLFALAGVGGALAAPIAGRLADRNLEGLTSAAAMVLLGASYAASIAAVDLGALISLAVFAVLIDAAVQTNQVVSRRTVFAVPPSMRGRANAGYMTLQFLGGAIGSTLATVSYHLAGWTGTAMLGVAVAAIALLLFGLETAAARRG